MKKLSTLAPAAFAAAGIIVIAAIIPKPASETLMHAEKSSASRKSLPKPGVQSSRMQPEFALNWTEGDEATWEESVQIKFAPNESTLAQADGTIVRARLHMRVANVGQDEIRIVAGCSNPEFKTNGRRIKAYEDLLAAEPVVLSLSPDARLIGFHISPRVSVEDRSAFLMLYGLEFVFRAPENYQETERDPARGTHLFTSSYRRLPGLVWRKSRSPAAGLAGAESEQQVTRSEFEAVPGHLWITSMRGTESSRLILGGTALGLAEAEFSLREIRGAAFPAHLASLAMRPEPREGLVPFGAASVPGSSQIASTLRKDALRETWGHVELPQMLEGLTQVVGRPMAEVTGPLKNMQNWLQVHPDRAADVLQSLTHPNDPELSGMIVRALSGAGNPESVGALSEILRSPQAYTPTAVVQAAAAAGELAGEADSRVIEGLYQAARSELHAGGVDLADVAGCALSRLARTRPELQEVIARGAEPLLAADSSPQDKVHALNLLENAGYSSQSASSLIAHSDPTVRTAALSYVGSLEATESIDRSLIQVLRSDPDAVVRGAAADALTRYGRTQSDAVRLAVRQYRDSRQAGR